MSTRRHGLPVMLAVGLAVAAAATGFRAAVSHGGPRTKAESDALAAAAGQLPPLARPAFVVRRPRLLPRNERVTSFAPIRRAVVARSEPSPNARPVTRLGLETPEGTTNLVLVVGDVVVVSAHQWVHIRLPVLPNNVTAWVPRAALGGYHFVHTRLVINRERLTATLFYDQRSVFHAPVGVGRPESPTPSGEFYVRDKLKGFGNPFYGPIAFGTSARSAVLTDWPGGGFVGIHGTNEPSLIPGRVSHGCVRLRNTDIRRLSRLMPVGTPITID